LSLAKISPIKYLYRKHFLTSTRNILFSGYEMPSLIAMTRKAEPDDGSRILPTAVAISTIEEREKEVCGE
jgi:hypothetical protein